MGKSTVIEILRILLNEKTKLEEVERFKDFEQKNKIDEKSFLEIEDCLKLCKTEIAELEDKIETLKEEYDKKESSKLKEIEKLNDIIFDKKLRFNFIEKILHFLKIKKIPEEVELKEIEKKLKYENQEHHKKLSQVQKEVDTTNNKFKSLKAKQAKMFEDIKKFVEYEDGKIIGDGRSDFTKENHIYEFEYDDKKFNLIDVPGIEGSEKKVMDTIWEAVKKAHAVFYVTNKAARPQTGDGKQKGTLEKIKEHLGMQTEVWALFNKRVNNPRQMKQLVNSDEEKSLQDLDDAFKEIFEERYCGYIPISALPGFLSTSECLAFGSDRYKQKQKFLKDNSADEVFEFSNIEFFKDTVEKISNDFPTKIKKANFFKANCTLDNAIKGIENELQNQIIPIVKKLNEETKNTNKQIELSVDKLKGDLKNSLNNVIRKSKSEMQKNIYDYIETDVNNKEFKAELERVLEDKKSQLPEKFDEAVQIEADKFVQNINKAVKRFKDRVQEFSDINTQSFIGIENIQLASSLLDLKDINMEKVTGMIGTAIGAGLSALALVSATGVGAIIIAVIGLISSLAIFAKSIIGFFNHDYRKSEQRKNADKLLNDFEAKFNEAISKSANKIYNEVKKNITNILDTIEKPAIKAKTTQQVIESAKINLINLQKDAKLYSAIA